LHLRIHHPRYFLTHIIELYIRPWDKIIELRLRGRAVASCTYAVKYSYNILSNINNFKRNGGRIVKKKAPLIIAASLLLLTLTGCIPGDGTHTAAKPAGFLWGIWHGWMAPVSLIVGFFNKSTRVYEALNTGWWYDLGFYMAIISGFGGLSLFRKDNKDKHKK
jgi:hypothetical protein